MKITCTCGHFHELGGDKYENYNEGHRAFSPLSHPPTRAYHARPALSSISINPAQILQESRFNSHLAEQAGGWLGGENDPGAKNHLSSKNYMYLKGWNGTYPVPSTIKHPCTSILSLPVLFKGFNFSIATHELDLEVCDWSGQSNRFTQINLTYSRTWS